MRTDVYSPAVQHHSSSVIVIKRKLNVDLYFNPPFFNISDVNNRFCMILVKTMSFQTKGRLCAENSWYAASGKSCHNSVGQEYWVYGLPRGDNHWFCNSRGRDLSHFSLSSPIAKFYLNMYWKSDGNFSDTWLTKKVSLTNISMNYGRQVLSAFPNRILLLSYSLWNCSLHFCIVFMLRKTQANKTKQDSLWNLELFQWFQLRAWSV